MFVVSMKTTRARVAAMAAGVGILAATVLLLAGRQGQPTQAAIGSDGVDRITYLEKLGYEVQADSEQVQEVQIPADADPVFSAYNALQKKAGQDLTPYCGQRVKSWSYTVTNYPGEEPVRARLYVYKDKVIGGDVSSVQHEGFSHGLIPLRPEEAPKR